MIENEIIENGNEISEALAKSLVARIANVEDIREVSGNSIERLNERVATGEATKEQILVLYLHKSNRKVMEAFMKGRAAVSNQAEYFRVGVIDGDDQVEKSILYDVAMLPKKGNSDKLQFLLEEMKNRDDIAFRILLSESIRFIENEIFLKDIIESFLEDKRDAVRGAPSGTNYFLRVCDVAAHEFYLRLGIKKEPRLSLSNDDLKIVSELYEKFISKKSDGGSSHDRDSTNNSINTRGLENLPEPEIKIPKNETPAMPKDAGKRLQPESSKPFESSEIWIWVIDLIGFITAALLVLRWKSKSTP